MLKNLLILILYLSFTASNLCAQFVKTKDNHFVINQTKADFIGCNYWYGGYLFSDIKNNGATRLLKELDFLNKKGITNLRVLFSGEGDSSYPFRLSPSLQPQAGVFNENILKSYDYFLAEAGKRKMKVIAVLNNNWEWSGGFGQYLEWCGYGATPLPKTAAWDWDKYCNYIAQFYTCDFCQILYQNFIQKLLNRKNSFNHSVYKNDPTIMAWELANEPRSMIKSAIPAYVNWIKSTAQFIKTIDQNHLVTTGVEGTIAMSDSVFTIIHQDKNIDYATLHIWPKTWRWYNGNPDAATTDTTLAKTKNYISHHIQLMKKINKPLVIEEFGMQRDSNSFNPNATTIHRDKFFEFIFKVQPESIASYNFWGAFGVPNQSHYPNDFWHQEMPYSADPPQEEQGLYSVFPTDSFTWKLLKKEAPKRK